MTLFQKMILLCLTSTLLITSAWAQEGNYDLSERIKVEIPRAIIDTKDESLEFVKQHYKYNKLDWKLVSQKKDDLEFKHLKFQQVYNEVPVHGGQMILHFNKSGHLYNISGQFIRISSIGNAYTLSENEAINIVLDGYPTKEYYGECNVDFKQNHTEKWIYTDSQTPPTYTYRVDIYSNKPLFRYDVFINASTGQDIARRDKIHMNDANGSGSTMYHGTRNFTTDSISSELYYLRNNVGGAGVHTWDYNEGTSSGVEFQDSDNNWTATANDDAASRDAHWGAEKAYNYFSDNHSFLSFDDSNSTINCRVHYDYQYSNAFWNGVELTFGDGDGTSYNPLTSIEVVGHELTHGVVQYTAGLEYLNESGALNESFADIFGCAIRHEADSANATYLIGDLISATSSAMRSLENPNLYNHPDCYDGTYWYTGSFDNGGVHSNSGVQNFWFYVLVNGDNGTNDLGDSYNVSGIGMDKATKIAFRNLSTYLTIYSTYSDARDGAIQAAIDLYGSCSDEVIQTTNAWYAVGVGDEYQNSTIANFSIDEPISCTLPHTVNFTNSSLNSSTYSWDFGDGSTSTLVSPSHTYTTAGVYDVTLIVSGSSTCGSGSDTLELSSSIDVSNGTAPSVSATCDNSFTYFSSSSKVQHFSISNLSHNASLFTSSIGDFTCEYAADLTDGSYYNLEITNGGTDKSVWIDFNNDGTFQSSENIYASSSYTTIDSALVLINNSTTVYNTPLRMRVVSANYSSVPQSCISFTSNGQQLEYTVTISPNTSPPIANFQTTGSTSIGTGQQINFQDISSGLPTSWQWTFEGATPNTISVQNPNNITYSAIGTYDVTLIATNSFGSDTLVIPDYITVSDQFNMCSTSSSNSPSGILFDSGGDSGPYQAYEDCSFLIEPGCANAITITFSELNLDAYDDFIKIYEGSDNTGTLLYSTSFSTIPPPLTVNAGSCYIEFTSNYYGNYSGWELSWTSDIPTTNPIADFTVADTIPFNYPTLFTDNSTVLTQSWLWSFGDGTVSMDQNPLKSFSDTGLFNVELIIDNCFGLDTVTKSVFVQPEPALLVLSDTIDVTVNCGDSTTASYWVYNEGSGDLIIDIETEGYNSTDLDIFLFQLGADINGEYNNLKTIITDSIPDANITEYTTINTSVFTANLANQDLLIIPELEYLNYTQQNHLINLQPVIQNFVSNGGQVLICGNGVSTVNATGLLNTSNTYTTSSGSLNTLDPSHVWLEGISLPLNNVSLMISQYVTTPGYTSIFETLSNYSALGYLPYGDGTVTYYGYDFYNSTTDIRSLLINIIETTATNSWLYIDTTTTIAPGDSTEVTINVDASNLFAGTYIDSFLTVSNDSTNALFATYVNLNILGESNIDLSTYTLDFDTVYQGTYHYDTVTVYNNGCDTLSIDSIISSDIAFTVSPTTFDVEPYSSTEIAIEFYTADVAVFNDSLTLYNNDTVQYIALNAVSVGAPIISFNPDSIVAEITTCGDSIVIPITIYNDGLGDLYGNINANSYLNDTLSSLFYDSFEDGDYNNWVSTSYGVSISTNTASHGQNSITLSSSYSTVTRYIEESTPTYFSFQFQQNLYYSSTSRVYLGNAYDADGVCYFWKYGDYIYFNNSSNSVLISDHSAWTQVELKNINYVNHTFDVYINNSLTISSVPFNNSYVDNVTLVQLRTSGSGSLMCNFDEITVGEGANEDLLTTNTDSLNILPGDSQIVNVTLYSSQLENGVYVYSMDLLTNIPDSSNISYPVYLTVSGESEISSNVTCLDFDTVLQHQVLESDTFWVYNTGCSTLDVSTIAYSSPFYSCTPDTLSINPFDSLPVIITIEDSVIGVNTDTAWFYTSDNDTLAICLNSIVLEAPIISASPDSVSLTINSCDIDSIIIPYTIYNTGGSNLNIINGYLPLEDVLDNVNADYSNITSVIPSLYSFSGGITGSSISDGGGDMYDGGNYLNTNLQNSIPYTSSVITSLPSAFGTDGQYFTAKHQGLFVMAADIHEINSFNISGNLGADGSGSVGSGSLSMNHNGVAYTGFYKKVHSAGDPSVNHLIIIETNALATQSISSSTNSDSHIIDGLFNNTRIYYILFAGSQSNNYPVSVFENVMSEFLDITNSISTFTGSIEPNDSLESEHIVYTSDFDNGTYDSEIIIVSNDPLNPVYTIPISIVVETPPCIINVEDSIIGCGGSVDFSVEHSNTASSISWDFGDGNIGSGENTSNIYSNPGTYPIEVITCNSISCDTFAYNLVITNTSGPIQATCTPASYYTYTSYGITNVSLNNISNSSLATQEGYEDFSCTDTTTLLTGTSYTLNVISASTFSSLYSKAWIDYNNNGNFENSEVVLDEQYTSSPFTSTVTIPTTGVVLNEPLRMRVAVDRNNSISSYNPCFVYYGEFEDYTVTINEPILYPISAFSTTDLSVCEGIVQFNDLTTNSPTSWAWDFGDGSTSNIQNPIHDYEDAGIYDVKLVASNANGSDSTIQNIIIKVAEANISVGAITGLSAPIQFTNTTTGISGYNWSFGDGNTSSVSSPTHAYTTASTYIVTLEVVNAYGCTAIDIDTVDLTQYIGINELDETIAVYPNPAKNNVNILNESSKNIKAINVVNALGQIVLHYEPNHDENKHILQVSELTKGVYTLSFVFNDQSESYSKLIIE